MDRMKPRPKSQKRKKVQRNTSDPLMRSVKRSARSARASGSAVTNSFFSFSFFKLALTGGVVLGFTALFFISGVFGGTKINLTLTTNPDLENGLVGHWTFDGEHMDNGVEDRSGQGNTGTLTNFTSTTTVRGRIGQALSFDASNDYIDVGTFDPSSGGDDLGISMWVYWKGSSGDHEGLIAKRDSYSSTNMMWNFARNVNESKLRFERSGSVIIFDQDIPSTNTWIHIAVTKNGSAVDLYFNGVLQDSGTMTFGTDTAAKVVIGDVQPNGGAVFNGYIDDVRLYSQPLSTTTIQRLYQLGATTKVNTTINTNPDLENGLVGHWTFDGEDLLQNVVDRGSAGNTGYLTNFTSTTTVRGRIGQALEFDGSNDWVDVGTDSSLDIGDSDISWGAWFKTTSTATHAFVSKGSGGSGGKRYSLSTRSSGTVHVELDDNAGKKTVASPTGFADGEWHHAIAVINGTNVHLYVDGSEVAASPTDITGLGDISSVCGFAIGQEQSTESCGRAAEFDGAIDDVRVYNRALSAAEVTRLYQLGATTHINTSINTNPDLENGLVGHWTFDGKDITADQILDRSGQGNHGGFFGGATTTAVVRGRIGQAMGFDGTADYVDVGDAGSLDIGTSDFTVMTWIKVVSSDANAMRIVNKRDGSNIGYELYIEAGDDKLHVLIGDSGGYTFGAGGSIGVKDDSWHHVGIVFNRSSDAIYYVDGIQDGTKDISLRTGDISNTNSLKIGRYGTSAVGYFNGSIDDTRIYNRALSVAEIQRLYDLGR